MSTLPSARTCASPFHSLASAVLAAAVALAGCAAPGSGPGPAPLPVSPAQAELSRLLAYAESTRQLSADELTLERALVLASVEAARAPSTENVRLALLFASGDRRDDARAVDSLERFLGSPGEAGSEVTKFARVLRDLIEERLGAIAELDRSRTRLAAERAEREKLEHEHEKLALEREKLERQIEALKAIERSVPARGAE